MRKFVNQIFDNNLSIKSIAIVIDTGEGIEIRFSGVEDTAKLVGMLEAYKHSLLE